MYTSILKIVLVISLSVIAILFMIENAGTIVTHLSPLLIASALLGELIWTLLSTIIQVFFWVTVTFIILDRTVKSHHDEPLSMAGEKWTPELLEDKSYVPLQKKITLGEVIFSFIWAILFPILYFNADKIIGVYDDFSFKIPLFNQDTLMTYVVFVLILIILELARVAYFAVARQWTFKLAWSNTIIHFIGFVFLGVIANEPNLFQPDFAIYMSDLLNKPLETIQSTMDWIKWFTVFTIIVTGIIDIYHGFRKAKIR